MKSLSIIAKPLGAIGTIQKAILQTFRVNDCNPRNWLPPVYEWYGLRFASRRKRQGPRADNGGWIFAVDDPPLLLQQGAMLSQSFGSGEVVRS